MAPFHKARKTNARSWVEEEKEVKETPTGNILALKQAQLSSRELIDLTGRRVVRRACFDLCKLFISLKKDPMHSPMHSCLSPTVNYHSYRCCLDIVLIFVDVSRQTKFGHFQNIVLSYQHVSGSKIAVDTLKIKHCYVLILWLIT